MEYVENATIETGRSIWRIVRVNLRVRVENNTNETELRVWGFELAEQSRMCGQ